MMARNTNVPFKGRIQKRKTNQLHIIIFGLQRAAGPYRRASFGLMRRSKRHLHSITLSARSSNDSDMVRPIALAVLRLMTSSYLDACSTGRSADLTPLRILST